MKLKFDSISVGLTDVLQMANREQQKRFVKRLIEVKFVPLKMKRKRNKRKSKEEVDRLELIKKEGRETEKNVDKKRKQRPSKKKRIIERKIKAGNLVDFRIKIKSKEWKNWVGK